MKIKPKYTIPIIWTILIICFLMSISCTNKEKYPNKIDTIAKALSKIQK
jgi:tryptophan-rich sensory protein